jgi:hypothetical protein
MKIPGSDNIELQLELDKMRATREIHILCLGTERHQKVSTAVHAFCSELIPLFSAGSCWNSTWLMGKALKIERGLNVSVPSWHMWLVQCGIALPLVHSFFVALC